MSLEHLLSQILRETRARLQNPPSPERVEWAHKLFGDKLGPAGGRPAQELTPEALSGVWVGLCWVQGCPMQHLDAWLDEAGKELGTPFVASSDGAKASAASATSNGTAKVEPQDDRDAIVARVRRMLEIIERAREFASSAGKSGGQLEAMIAAQSVATLEKQHATLSWVLDPTGHAARRTRQFYEALEMTDALIATGEQRDAARSAAGVA